MDKHIRSGNADGRAWQADIWSYGMLLFELLALEVPYRSEQQPDEMHGFSHYCGINFSLHFPSLTFE